MDNWRISRRRSTRADVIWLGLGLIIAAIVFGAGYVVGRGSKRSDAVVVAPTPVASATTQPTATASSTATPTPAASPTPAPVVTPTPAAPTVPPTPQQPATFTPSTPT